MTLARPGLSTRAAVRSASRRRGAFAYSSVPVPGTAIGTAPSRAPARVATAAGDPVVGSITGKAWNTGGWSTPHTVFRAGLRCTGLAKWDWGAFKWFAAGGGG